MVNFLPGYLCLELRSCKIKVSIARDQETNVYCGARTNACLRESKRPTYCRAVRKTIHSSWLWWCGVCWRVLEVDWLAVFSALMLIGSLVFSAWSRLANRFTQRWLTSELVSCGLSVNCIIALKLFTALLLPCWNVQANFN